MSERVHVATSRKYLEPSEYANVPPFCAIGAGTAMEIENGVIGAAAHAPP